MKSNIQFNIVYDADFLKEILEKGGEPRLREEVYRQVRSQLKLMAPEVERAIFRIVLKEYQIEKTREKIKAERVDKERRAR